MDASEPRLRLRQLGTLIAEFALAELGGGTAPAAHGLIRRVGRVHVHIAHSSPALGDRHALRRALHSAWVDAVVEPSGERAHAGALHHFRIRHGDHVDVVRAGILDITLLGRRCVRSPLQNRAVISYRATALLYIGSGRIPDIARAAVPALWRFTIGGVSLEHGSSVGRRTKIQI